MRAGHPTSRIAMVAAASHQAGGPVPPSRRSRTADSRAPAAPARARDGTAPTPDTGATADDPEPAARSTAAQRGGAPSAPAPDATLLRPPGRAPVPAGALTLLRVARDGLAEAQAVEHAADRYATAHLAALRGAAAVLAARSRPLDGNRRRRLRSAWSLLPEVAPELAEWAAYFAAGAAKRAAAEAGLPRAATPREADDLIRAVEQFLILVASLLGVPHQSALPYAAGRTG